MRAALIAIIVLSLSAHRPVGEVAARWGFPDAAHFSRAFRAEFGEPPSAVRARAIAR